MSGDEDLVTCAAEPLDVHGDLPRLDSLPDGLSHHRGCQGAPCHADQLHEWRPESEALENLVLEGETAGQRQCRYIFPLGREACGILVEQRVQFDHRDTPLVHHAPGTHACTTAGPIHRQQIDSVPGRVRQRLRQRRGPIGTGLEEDVLGT